MAHMLVRRKPHKCWNDEGESKKLCGDLIKVTHSDCGYTASELLDTMNEIYKGMHDRHCFRPCFLRMFLLAAIVNERADLVTLLLLSEKQDKRSISKPCSVRCMTLLNLFQDQTMELLNPESLFHSKSLTPANATHLYVVLCEEFLEAVDYFCIVNQLDKLKLLLSYERNWTQCRVSKYHSTPLHMIIIRTGAEGSRGYEFRLPELVQLMIDEGGSKVIHAYDDKGRTPLALLMEAAAFTSINDMDDATRVRQMIVETTRILLEVDPVPNVSHSKRSINLGLELIMESFKINYHIQDVLLLNLKNVRSCQNGFKQAVELLELLFRYKSYPLKEKALRKAVYVIIKAALALVKMRERVTHFPGNSDPHNEMMDILGEIFRYFVLAEPDRVANILQ